MRFTAVLFAGLAAAAPQVQPISQISDGQIQAPPATSAAVPVASSYKASVSAPVVVSSAPVVVRMFFPTPNHKPCFFKMLT